MRAARATDPGRVALFGTSADPPTCGHQALLEGLLLHYPRVVTWASDNPLKRHHACLELRSALLAALVAQINNPRLTQVQQLSSPFAIETLDRAAELWPGAELVFVVGSDLADQIPRWKQAGEVLRRCRLAIAPRVDQRLEPELLATLEQLGATVELLAIPVPATASSQLRRAPDPRQIPAAVWTLLRQHKLYGLPHP
ncbi:MAG: nicotinate-nucleotide adenylyltransferase [Cyanobacteriota bacterium]|nr:nicotinate-nucleotide adenylyltransferase [Cyanobacteriota bacterium]